MKSEPEIRPDTTVAAVLKAGKSQILDLLEGYTTRNRAIRRCATEHIQLAVDAHSTFRKRFEEKLSAIALKQGKVIEDGEVEIAVTYETIQDITEVLVRDAHPHSDIISQGLLIFGFSAFDAFFGMFLRQLYHEEPQVIYRLEEKEVKVSELLNSNSLEQVIANIIERDVSSLLRKSYRESFSILENRHGLQTLKKFDSWPKFVEASQRRNLITHCNGIVNSQYIECCKAEGVNLPESHVPGVKLKVDAAYLQSALDVLYDVGVRLAHTLWRKSSPRRIEESEKWLTDEVFRILKREEWALAKAIAEFAINIPNQKSDVLQKITRLNYAQALKWSGEKEEAISVLRKIDWSASIRDLRLGEAVLREDFDEAAKLMRAIGKRGELVLKEGYETWPVFREFRKTEQFQAAFKKIYGTDFAPPADNGKVANLPENPLAINFPLNADCGKIESPIATGGSKMPSEQPIENEELEETEEVQQ